MPGAAWLGRLAAAPTPAPMVARRVFHGAPLRMHPAGFSIWEVVFVVSDFLRFVLAMVLVPVALAATLVSLPWLFVALGYGLIGDDGRYDWWFGHSPIGWMIDRGVERGDC